MAITASTISSTQTLEEFRLEFNKLRSDVSDLERPGSLLVATIIFEGDTADAYETTLTVTDPTADRTITLPNATGTVLLSGDVVTATTFEPTGTTAAGDNAAIGYTSADGLILTGQGTTSDVTLKNDADGTVFTVPTGTDDILFPDSAKAMWGTGSDLTIHHDGTNSYISDNGSGALYLLASIFQVNNSANSKPQLACYENGATALFYDGNQKFTTSSTGITISGATAFGGNTLTNFSEVANAAVNTSTAATVPSDTNVVRYTLNGNATITLPASQPAGSAAVKTIVLYFKQDGTGSRTMALAAPGGESISYNNSSSQPTVNATASKVTIYTCMKFDSDTVWYVSQSYIDD